MADNDKQPESKDEFDFIIVGSGAGGAPLAARLAREGKRVLVIEAGPNQSDAPATAPQNEVSRVPATHAASSEHPDLSWQFFVDHYKRNQRGQLPEGIEEDPKWHDPADGDAQQTGIFYPRASGVGGCTIHNAMITVLGPLSDWDNLASFLGDDTWNGRQMQAYFKRLEHNDYHPVPDHSRLSRSRAYWTYVKNGFLYLIGRRPDTNAGKHGFQGWLHTSFTDITLGLKDTQLIKMLAAAVWGSKKSGLDTIGSWKRFFLRGRYRQALDPNHSETMANSPEGIALIPLAVHGGRTTIHQDRSMPFAMLGRRSSPREYLLSTLALHPENLTIMTDCLVTKVILKTRGRGDDAKKVAVGVEYQEGASLYRAHPDPSEKDGKKKTLRVRPGGEVILCGGSFNTPQLLMLSGIGEKDDDGNISLSASSEPPEKPIKCEVDLPGVGKNLQDRYEVSVVSEMNEEFALLKGATFNVPEDPEQPDRHLRRWREEGTGLYSSNGGVLAILKRSRPDLAQPDLFIFGVPLKFEGYEVGYSNLNQKNLFSWVILKAHTENRDGWVKLRSTDPRDTPEINFNYFQTISRAGKSETDPDLQAVVHGVRFVRDFLKNAKRIVRTEVHPGSEVSSDDAVRDWVRRDAWGHHACGTCRMGPDGDKNAVLDSRFRVRNVSNLRIVDASIFPTIPGYFIVSNIYMASEKAADVIIEDHADDEEVDLNEYPKEMRELEAKTIRQRREEASQTSRSDVPEPEEVEVAGQWPADLTGLALSGGGIRSATFCLGLLQDLAKNNVLRRVDYLSTVSGGGYIGSFLGRFYDRMRDAQNLNSLPAVDRAEREIASPTSPELDWLRSHGNYIAPGGRGDGRYNFAIFLRNLLSVHLIIFLLLFSAFGLANAIRYGLFDQILATWMLFFRQPFPVGNLVESVSGPWFSPWFMLAEAIALFVVLPRILGYWIVSPTKHNAYKTIPLVLLFVIAGTLLFFGVHEGLKLQLVLLGLAMFSSLAHVEYAWYWGRLREAAVGTGGPAAQRARTRNDLTYDLGLALALTGITLAFSLIDTISNGLHEWLVRGNATYTAAFASLMGAIVALTPVAQWLAKFFASDQASGPRSLVRMLRRDMIAGLLAIVLFTLPLVLYCFASHAVYRGGAPEFLWWGIGSTLVALALSIAFTLPGTWSFVNRSSLANVYAARLARAYLGASNPARHRPEGRNVAEVMPGDDVDSIRQYRPYGASGPLHLINVTVNQTIDYGSRLAKRDRQGTNMAVSSVGVTVGEQWHSEWVAPSDASQSLDTTQPVGLKPVGRHPGEAHPFIDELNRSADRAEVLSLRQWIAISGAAVDPGRGRNTNLGTALLFGLVNLRTGHWWDSGITESDRVGFPAKSPMRRILYLLPRVFTTQALLLYEWLARYPGPWQRFWHLSDGGYFENLGVYELIRRRVPRIIACDGGADPNYELSDFSELVRKVRIDFGARIEPLSEAEIDAVKKKFDTQDAFENIGTIEQLRPAGGASIPSKHATLCWVHYPRAPRQSKDRPTSSSLMLYIKASVNGDESEDIRNYHQAHPSFPHESTADQFFDEAQWESYRKLGEHIGELFDTDWFWNVDLPTSIEEVA